MMEMSVMSYSGQVVLLSSRESKVFKARVARLRNAAPPRRVAVQKLREVLGQFRTSFVRIFLKLCKFP
jgi:hypothetical protein